MNEGYILIGGVVVLAFTLGWYLCYKINFTENKNSERTPLFTKAKIHNDHLAPSYYGYEGGFDSTTKCVSCERIGLYEYQHPTNPCSRCGGVVNVIGSAKWMNNNGLKMWVKPNYNK